ncbi:ABC transporter substrate-binding protein [Paenibacillus sp. FSL W7-1287]|uniref:ABC transporter substrate-binding protein n=1 Tax=Paenibacillus sp. FSL W7-1287 TaxID=2954538 RepID=UPI0030F7BF6F
MGIVKLRISVGSFLLILLVLLQGCGGGAVTSQERFTIGYQSTTAQTWGALIIKNKKLLEKHLEELLPGQEVTVEWFDASAGSVLNNNMIGGKIQLSFLGDMPSLLNGVQGKTRSNYDSVLLALDGKGVSGRNQGIVTPNGSSIHTIEELAGKTVSTPIGSSAHRMLLDMLREHGLIEQVTIVDQSVSVGMQSIEQRKIDVHATWEPYLSLIDYRGIGQLLQSGETTNVDYLTAVVANRDWAQSNRTYVIAFLRALYEAHQFISNHPTEAAEIFAEESKFPLEVCHKLVASIRFDSAIYNKDLNTLNGSIAFLSEIGKLQQKLDLNDFVDDQYLREALHSLDKPYLTDEELKGDWIEDKRL